MAKIISEGQGPFSYDPRANVGTLLCRSKFGMGAYPDLIDELSGKFVETLFDLQADQDSKLEFRESRTMLSGFAGSKGRRAYHSVMEIVHAIYPFLKCKGLKYAVGADDPQRFDDPTATNATLYWCFAGSSTAEMFMDYRTQKDFDQDRMRVIVTHSFTFRANSAWVDERAKDRKILEAGNMPDCMLAFAMGCHKRLGERSQIRAINGDLLFSLGKIVLNLL